MSVRGGCAVSVSHSVRTIWVSKIACSSLIALVPLESCVIKILTNQVVVLYNQTNRLVPNKESFDSWYECTESFEELL